MRRLIFAVLLCLLPSLALATVRTVGAGKDYTVMATCFAALANGDTIESYGGVGGYTENNQTLQPAAGITGVTWVSGDLHFPAIMDLEVEGPYAGMIDILAGPAGNGPVGLTALFEDAPPFHWWANEMNWVRFDLDPSLGTLEVAFISEQGDVLYSEVFTA